MHNFTNTRNPVSTNGTPGGIRLAEAQTVTLDNPRSLPDHKPSETIDPELPGRVTTLPHWVNSPQDRLDEVQAELEIQAQELLQQADAYLVQGKIEPAIAHYRRALEFAPHLVDAHQGLAEALTQQGHLEEAATHYQKAIALLPSLPETSSETTAQMTASEETLCKTVPIQVDTPEPADPEPILDQLPWYERAAFYLQQGKAFCDRQQWQETIAVCEQAAQLLAPQTALTFRLLGRALQAEKQLGAAEASYQKSLALQPDLAENHARMGSICADQQRLTESVTFLQQAIDLEPEFAGAHLTLGEVWEQLGDRVQAADCFYQAYQLEPGWVTAKEHLQLGNLLMSQGKLEQASWCYRQVIEFAPASPNGYHNLAIVLGKQQQWDKALHYHQQAIQRQPENPRLHAALAQVFTKLNRWQEAIDCYERVIQLKPEYSQVQEALLQIEGCQRASMAESYGNMAATFAAEQQWQQAIDCYRQAIQRNPQQVAFRVGLAQAYGALKQWDEAADCYQQAIALQPNPQYCVALADILVKLGRFEEATQYYRQRIPDRQAAPLSAPATVSEAALAIPVKLAYTVL